jgi:hypothetical protein
MRSGDEEETQGARESVGRAFARWRRTSFRAIEDGGGGCCELLVALRARSSSIRSTKRTVHAQALIAPLAGDLNTTSNGGKL